MIVKNEEAVLARCLDSIAEAVDEIIIVDTGSTDKTKEIAAKYANKVLDFEWINDFSAARNFAFEAATMDYQMWLDADDVLPDEEREKLLELKESLDPDVDMVTMKYHTNFDKNQNPLLTSTRERLLKRENNYKWQDPVHECIPLSGRIHHSDITIWHQKPPSDEMSTRNLNIYEAVEKSGKIMTPRQIYYFARELKDHRQFAKAAYYFRRFLDTKEGWSEDNIAACFLLSICYAALKEDGKVLPVLFESFHEAAPRAEICCEIGYFYKRKHDYKTALDWFSLALKLENPDSLGFVLQDYWGFIPSIESCVCCCALGQYERAMEYNKIASQFKPDNPAVMQNMEYISRQIADKVNP